MTLFDQFFQVALTYKFTWSSYTIENMFVEFLVFLNQIVDIRIIILSSTVHEIWSIDPIWPTLSTDLDYQGHVIFRQNRKCICSIPCSLKLYTRHRNNDYIVYRSRDMADCRGVFRGPLGYGPLWPKNIFLTLKKIWKTWLAPLVALVWALVASDSLAPLSEILNTPLADWPLFDQLCQVTLIYKVTWSSDNLKNMFAEFRIL